ncbi:hypothetical protein PI124_g16732 [Phytophthora idaei]|nr:hypothetical protein PI125_g12294 [Phytophthora idaei]KAG3142381.1 hypothetical protein PI126_g15067 [Phytophthora idaei]KAG3238308.1 hypothetical protein PI124_g16732 [Phytophthora idaei]
MTISTNRHRNPSHSHFEAISSFAVSMGSRRFRFNVDSVTDGGNATADNAFSQAFWRKGPTPYHSLFIAASSLQSAPTATH